AIELSKCTITGGPNFALRFLLKKMARSPQEKFDLSSVEVFYCGAEPISPQTVSEFLSRSSQYGLSERCFYACYGMAESTLIIAGVEYNSNFYSYDMTHKVFRYAPQLMSGNFKTVSSVGHIF